MTYPSVAALSAGTTQPVIAACIAIVSPACGFAAGVSNPFPTNRDGVFSVQYPVSTVIVSGSHGRAAIGPAGVVIRRQPLCLTVSVSNLKMDIVQ